MKADRTPSLKEWFRPPRQVLVTFLGVAVLSTAALGYLATLVLRQEHQLEADRQRTALEQAADAGIGGLQRRLAELIAVAGQTDVSTPLPEGVVHAVIAPQRTIIRAAAALPYLPETPGHAPPPAATFESGERAEFREGDLRRARGVYAALARSPEAAVRAGALARLARVQRRLKDVDGALATYTALEQVGEGVHAVSYPASLAAAMGRMSALQEGGRTGAARASAEALASDLLRGRWALQRGEFQARLQEAEQAGAATGIRGNDDRLALAEALDWLWSNRHALGDASRQTIRTAAGPALLAWQRNADKWTAVVAGPAYVGALCPPNGATGVRCVITDVDGGTVSGERIGAPARTETRTVPGLPWTVHFLIDPDAGGGRTAVNRWTLTLLFAALGVVLALGWYFILRSISREIRTSRMQTDFVAAVSHEFRTPLTALAHISQMLAEDRVPSDPLRKAAYGTLVRETDRLRRLVESLLEFGRFEAGGVQLRMERTDAAALVGDVVREYEDPLRGSQQVIRLSPGAGPAIVRADREALARVVWNLLDNAVKYSSDAVDVEVTVSRSREAVSIAVRDRGIGIPAHEQREIFQRFVRGAESKARRIKGTGIGLALVQQIVRAHGGSIALDSAVGEGSTFTVVLPVDSDPTPSVSTAVQVTAS